MRRSAGDENENWYWNRSTQFHRRYERRWFNQGRHGRRFRTARVWRRKDETISIFVDNIDFKTTTEIIRSRFEKFGEVCDVFISGKKRATNPRRFGFVRMKGPRNAIRAIENLRGQWIGNSRIFVKEARFKKQSSKIRVCNGIKKWVPKNEVIPRRRRELSKSEGSMEPIDQEKFVTVKVNPNMVEELERSLIGESEEPRSVEVLSQILTNQWMSITKVRDLGPYKFIVTFIEKEDMEHVVKMENPPLLQYFSKIYPWDIYQQGDTRRIWVEVMGIPPQVWSRDTCESIACKFGTLVCWDSRSESPESFVTCRMMIDTNIMSYIAEVLYLSIDEHSIGKTIFVREGSNVTSCYIKQPLVPNVSSSTHQWDDEVLSVNNHTQTGDIRDSGEVEVKATDNISFVVETPPNNEGPEESERTITVVGDVNYDINEENDLILRRLRANVTQENLSIPLLDDDCPPGFQKILNSRKFSRRSKSSSKVWSHMSCNQTNDKRSKTEEAQALREEIIEGAELSRDDNNESWSEDDFEYDRTVEKRKSMELGRLLGLGVGEKLNIDDLLK